MEDEIPEWAKKLIEQTALNCSKLDTMQRDISSIKETIKDIPSIKETIAPIPEMWNMIQAAGQNIESLGGRLQKIEDRFG